MHADRARREYVGGARRLAQRLLDSVTMKNALRAAAVVVLALSGTALAASNYKLHVDAPPAKVSKESVAKVLIEPQSGYHINVDYPTRLTMHAPDGVALRMEKLTAKDAAKLDKASAEFDVAFTAGSKGKKSFTGELRFAVCSADNCEPHTESVAFDVDVR